MLLFIFIIIPMIEIALFIQVGGWLGLWSTLAIIILTAVIGTYLLRLQGMAELAKLQSAMQGRGNPVKAIANGALILVSGVLLLTPGFFTDAVGFSLLIPPARAMVIKWLSVRFANNPNAIFTQNKKTRYSKHTTTDTKIVDVDYVILDGEDKKKPGNSGWTERD